MSDQELINSIFPGCENIQMRVSKNIDTISSKFSKSRAIVPYDVIDDKNEEHNIIIKHKNSLVVPLGATQLSPNFNVFLKVVYAHRIFGFDNGRKREKSFYEKVDNSLRAALPQFLGANESLRGHSVSLVMLKFSQGNEINFNDLYKIIDSITDFHAKYYGKQKTIEEMNLNYYTPKDYRRARGTLRALFQYYHDDNVRIYGEKLARVLSSFIEHIDKEYMTTMSNQTLTHNDLTPRNIHIDDGKIIIYDWELACYQNPEHDLVELLFTTIDNNCTSAQIREVIAYFRKQLDDKIQRKISDEEFAKFMRFNALEYAVNRLAIYRSYSKKNPCKLAKRCERNAHKVLEACLWTKN